MAKKEDIIREARAKALKKASCFQRVFNSPDGKVVLDELKAMYGESKINVPGDPFATHVRVGQLEVLQYITEVMEVENNE